MADTRKSLQRMKAEYDQDRHLYGKVFHHYKNGDDYQLLYPAWSEDANEKMAVFVLCAMPWLKFTRPFAVFKETFVEGPAVTAEREKVDA